MGTTLLALFSALAVLVAAIGLYATFAYVVSERRREMAIRLAVGARPSGVLLMVLREAIVLAVTGAAAGLHGRGRRRTVGGIAALRHGTIGSARPWRCGVGDGDRRPAGDAAAGPDRIKADRACCWYD